VYYLKKLYNLQTMFKGLHLRCTQTHMGLHVKWSYKKTETV